MHLTSLFAALTALAIGVQAGLPSRDALDAREATKTNRYIVEFDNTANLQAAGLKRVDNAIHERMYTDLRARGISFSVFQEYTADIFVGASIAVDSEADLANLAGAAGVINIIPVHLIPIPDVPTGVDRDFVRASLESIPGGGQVAANATQAIFAAPGTVRRTGFSALPQISADKVQATGNFGKGIKIGIIDTGVDYTRTPLGGCFGPGCKVVGGFDFVGDNYNGQNVPVPGGLPLDKCSGHGTVTAGIIGANDNEYGVPGVAPEASLYAYRTYGCVGTSGEDVLFLAMQRAYQDGVDVLNLSLGEVASWTSSALSVMASRLVARGIIVVAAAGNNQVAGPFLGSAPATGFGVLGVGSVNNSVLPAHNLTTSTGYGPIRMYNYRNFPEGTYPIATYPDDPYGCEPAPIDLSGKIVVIRKGRCDALTKARNAFSLYGQYILFVPDGDEEPFYYDYRTLNGADVSKADGDWLFANTGATLTAGFRPAPRPNTYSGGRGTYFSNQGPTNDLFLNTDILAPGNNIVGVLPDNADLLLTNWSITDGTSWSSAFASGSAALYLKSKDASPAEIDRAFLNTADPIATTNTDSTLLSISQQGAGVLNLADAIKTSTVIEPSVLLLNDTAYFEGRQVITITNNGRSDRNYQLKNVAAGTQLALDPASNYTNDFPTPQVNNGAQLQASRSDSSFRLRPGRSRRIQLTFTAPQGLDPKTLPVYSGYVQVTSEEGVQNVPYIGVARRMRDNAVFDGTDRFFGPGFKLPLTADYATLSVSPAGKVYTFQGSDYPAVFYRFLGGSRAVYIDLVRADANLGFMPTYTKRDETTEWEADFGVEARDFASVHVNRRWFWDNWFGNGNNGNNGNGLTNFDKLLCKLTGDFFPLCRDKQGSFAKVPTVGNLVTQTLVTRDRSDAGIFQLFEFSQPNFRNQTRVPNGNYRFLLRGLKVTGDPTKNEEYESYVSPPFTIQPPLV